MRRNNLILAHGNVDFAKPMDEAAEVQVHSASCRICAIMRTHLGHANVLIHPLFSLTHQEDSGVDISVRVFLTNTDAVTYGETKFMVDAAEYTNSVAGFEAVKVLPFRSSIPWSHAYGYDVTDIILDELLETSDCTHFLFTNGDNYYNKYWLTHIAGAIKDGMQMIAWDFTTHHLRESNMVSVKFQRTFVDLGSVLVDRRAIERTGARFVPHGLHTTDFFARDWFFFKHILDVIGKKNVAIVHQVLFMHQ